MKEEKYKVFLKKSWKY